MSTSRFAVLAGLLVLMIGAIVGVLFVLLRSGGASDKSAAPTGTTREPTSTSSPTSTTTVAPRADLAISFSAPAVQIQEPVRITVREAHGRRIGNATLQVDGRSVPVSWQKMGKGSVWTGMWSALRDGAHRLLVTATSQGVTQTGEQRTTVQLPQVVQQAMARVDDFIAALKARDLGAVNQILNTRRESLEGYADVSDARVFYLSHSATAQLYTIRTAYVVHQEVPAAEPNPGAHYTALYCTTWTVDLAKRSQNLTQSDTTVIEDRPRAGKPDGGAPQRWVPFPQYRRRLDECG
jgi:hypothetical protein